MPPPSKPIAPPPASTRGRRTAFDRSHQRGADQQAARGVRQARASCTASPEPRAMQRLHRRRPPAEEAAGGAGIDCRYRDTTATRCATCCWRKASLPASPPDGTATGGCLTARGFTSCAIRWKTSSPNSRTGDALPPAMTAVPISFSLPSSSPPLFSSGYES